MNIVPTDNWSSLGTKFWRVFWAKERFKGKALISVILRLAWSAYIYHLWRERIAGFMEGSIARFIHFIFPLLKSLDLYLLD